MAVLSALAVLLSFVAGCVTALPSPAKDYTKGALTGYIDGKPWTYKHAYIDPTIRTPEEDDFVFVFLPYKPKKACPRGADEKADQRSVMVSAPKATKALLLKRGTSHTLIFHFEKGGEQVATAAKTGKFKLLSITDREVRGKVLGNYSNGNWVSGTFTAAVCDYREMKEDDPKEDYY